MLLVRWVDRLGRNCTDVCDTILDRVHAARRGGALIIFMAAAAQTQAEATGSSALAAGHARRQVKPEGA